jgi:hypothetical protein
MIRTVSGVIVPSASMASIIETPMRSLTLAIGLKNSSLARMSALTPRICGRRLRRTIGVSPIVSVIESKMRPRPGARADAVASGADVLAVSCKVASCGRWSGSRLYTQHLGPFQEKKPGRVARPATAQRESRTTPPY